MYVSCWSRFPEPLFIQLECVGVGSDAGLDGGFLAVERLDFSKLKVHSPALVSGPGGQPVVSHQVHARQQYAGRLAAAVPELEH